MLRKSRLLLAAGVFLLPLLISGAQAEGDDPLVENPRYKFWAEFKKGSRAVHVEEVKYMGENKPFVPGGVSRKIVTYVLQKVTPKAVTVRTFVRERDFLSIIVSPPTLHNLRLPK